MKHNNIIPNLHFHKKYCASSRGPLKVKLRLNQATKKKSRRLARSAKAASIAPRPLQLLRPVVHGQTQKYNAKVRLGRGFTVDELKAVGFSSKYARTVGIAVDERRINRCEESYNANVERLKEYQSKLIVFPRKRVSKPKNGDSTMEEMALATQYSGTIMPLPSSDNTTILMETITDEMKDFKAFTTMRVANKETRVAGHRISVQNRKKKD